MGIVSCRHAFTGEVGRSWLASAKIARKAGQWQTAYSAVLQAQQSKARFSFMESAKLVKATGEPLRALQELENSMRLLGLIETDVIDLTDDDDETKKMKAKVSCGFLVNVPSRTSHTGSSSACAVDERVRSIRDHSSDESFFGCNRTTDQVGAFAI